MNQHKIIFSGPVGAGKTTAIDAISDEPPIRTDANASDMTKQRKSSTTVTMDYGVMNLSEGEKIDLHGTPGQERFSFMWDIVTTGGIGLVLLLNNARPDPFHGLRFFLRTFKPLIDETEVVIGVTQMDLKHTPILEEYHGLLREYGLTGPMFEIDARVRDDVSILIQALLYSLDPLLEET